MLEPVIFWVCAGLLVSSGMMVVFHRETMHSILWLVFSFVVAATLWVFLNAEFLGLLLILVYVGAVLTLFLFVIMTLPTPSLSVKPGLQLISHRMLSFSIAFIGLGCILYGLHNQIMLSASEKLTMKIAAPLIKQTNTQALGIQLYTDFIYPFELVGILLLTAIIVSISLHSNSHILDATNEQKKLSQRDQIHIKRQDRVKLVKGD